MHERRRAAAGRRADELRVDGAPLEARRTGVAPGPGAARHARVRRDAGASATRCATPPRSPSPSAAGASARRGATSTPRPPTRSRAPCTPTSGRRRVLLHARRADGRRRPGARARAARGRAVGLLDRVARADRDRLQRPRPHPAARHRRRPRAARLRRPARARDRARRGARARLGAGLARRSRRVPGRPPAALRACPSWSPRARTARPTSTARPQPRRRRPPRPARRGRPPPRALHPRPPARAPPRRRRRRRAAALRHRARPDRPGAGWQDLSDARERLGMGLLLQEALRHGHAPDAPPRPRPPRSAAS